MCGQQKWQNRAKRHVWLTLKKKKKNFFFFFFFLNFTNSVSSRQFREFRDFSAIAENHWPYNFVLDCNGDFTIKAYSSQSRLLGLLPSTPASQLGSLPISPKKRTLCSYHGDPSIIALSSLVMVQCSSIQDGQRCAGWKVFVCANFLDSFIRACV